MVGSISNGCKIDSKFSVRSTHFSSAIREELNFGIGLKLDESNPSCPCLLIVCHMETTFFNKYLDFIYFFKEENYMGLKLVHSIGEKSPNLKKVSIFMIYWLNDVDMAKNGTKIGVYNRMPIEDAPYQKH